MSRSAWKNFGIDVSVKVLVAGLCCNGLRLGIGLGDADADGLAGRPVADLDVVVEPRARLGHGVGFFREIVDELGLVVRDNVNGEDEGADALGVAADHPIKELVFIVEVKLLLIPDQYLALAVREDWEYSRLEAVSLLGFGEDTGVDPHRFEGLEDLSTLVFVHRHGIAEDAVDVQRVVADGYSLWKWKLQLALSCPPLRVL